MTHAHNIKWPVIYSGICLLILVGTGFSQNPEILRAPVTDYPPYEYVDTEGHAAGVVPALLRELARRVGRPIEFVSSNPRTAQRGIDLGRFDIYVLPRTQEQERQFTFIPSTLYHYREVVLAAPTFHEGLESVAQLSGRKVAVAEDDVAEILLRRHPGIERIIVPDYETGLRLVADGHAELFVGNHDVALYLIDTGRVPALRPVLLNILATPACFATRRKADPELVNLLSKAAKSMVNDGTVEQISASWLGREFRPPVETPWVVEHLKIIITSLLCILLVLFAFILLLRSLVKQKTRRLTEAQDFLKRNEARYRQVFNTMAEAIFIIDLKGMIQACSDYVFEIYGYRPEDLVGKHVSICAPLDMRNEIEDDITKLCELGSLVHQVENVRRDGTKIQVELSERVILWDKDPVIVSCVKDITGQKQVEEALRVSQEKLARAHRMEMAAIIAGQIAHDFNNLLSPLLGLPEYIREELPEDSRARDDLTMIEKAASRMAEISQQLLTLGRRGHYIQKPLDLNKIVQDAVQGLGKRVPPEIEIKEDYVPGGLPVRGGGAQILRAFSNLLWNAIEAMPQGGVLSVTSSITHLTEPIGERETFVAGPYALVTVQDSGVGIPETVRDRLFEPFFTTKQTAKQRRGHGLGLSVVQGVIEDHRGYVKLESVPGRGSTFFIYLPVNEHVEEENVAASTIHGSEHILLVDDDPLQLDVLGRILERLGYQVSKATNSEEALSKLESTTALVVLDMILDEDVSGADVYRSILEVRPDLKAVVVSGYAETTMIEQVQALGVVQILRKPVSPEELARAVRSQLDA